MERICNKIPKQTYLLLRTHISEFPDLASAMTETEIRAVIKLWLHLYLETGFRNKVGQVTKTHLSQAWLQKHFPVLTKRKTRIIDHGSEVKTMLRLLVDHGLLEHELVSSKSSRGGAEHRTYGVYGLTPELHLLFSTSCKIIVYGHAAPDFGSVDLFNLRTGTTDRFKIVTDYTGMPQLMKQALSAYGHSIINLRGFFKYLWVQQSMLNYYKSLNMREYYSATKSRIEGDISSLAHIAQYDTYTEPGLPQIIMYKAAYKMSSGGRVFAIGRGFQGLTSEAKYYCRIGTAVQNYDIRSCHVQCLRHLFAEYGQDSKWLSEYVTMGSEYYADALGVPTSLWKQMLYSTLNGARTKIDTNCPEANALTEILMRHFCLNRFQPKKHELIKVHNAFARYQEIVNPMVREVSKIRKLIVDNPTNGRIKKPRWVNACGLSFMGTDTRFESKLLAFMVQGLEAQFIHTLSHPDNCVKYGYTVVDNEHDGICTIGDIPQEAIADVQASTGINMDIVKKPHIDAQRALEFSAKIHTVREMEVQDLINDMPDLVAALKNFDMFDGYTLFSGGFKNVI